MFLLGMLCYPCLPKNLGSLKAVSLKMQMASAHMNEHLSCKKNGNSLLNTLYFVHYTNIWTNVNSNNHNT